VRSASAQWRFASLRSGLRSWLRVGPVWLGPSDLTSARSWPQTVGVERARKHQVLLGRLALGLLLLIAELAGRSLTTRIDVGRHVRAPSYSGADYYPFLLAAVKVGVALMLARLAWRFVRARSVASAAHRLLEAHGRDRGRGAPRVRLALTPQLWLWCFLGTSVIFLLQTDAERISTGRWPLLAPWLHTSALPVFAVLSVVVAVIYSAVTAWFADYESYAYETAARASRLRAAPPPARRVDVHERITPRGLFGVAFEVRPPPAPA
jgi:hypothetical protein